jgi:hypothetical protein
VNLLAHRRSLLIASLVALVLGLAWGGYTVHKSGQWDGPVASAGPVVAPQPLSLPEVAVDALLKKPLFNPQRRAPEAPLAAPAAATLPSLTLVGVVREASRLGVLLRTAGGENSGLLRPQQSFAGWTVVSVEPRRAKVRSGEQVVVLELQAESGEQLEAVKP